VFEMNEENLFLDPNAIEFSQKLPGSNRDYVGKYNSLPTIFRLFSQDSLAGRELESFKKELAVMRKIQSSYVIHIYGLFKTPTNTFMIASEYCERGSLFQILQQPNTEINWELAINILSDIAQGLSYLHKSSVLHKSLSSNSIYVSQNWTSKVGKIGLSRLDTDRAQQSTLVKISSILIYASPEAFRGSFTSASDVYSFGIVAVELANYCSTRKYCQPYSDFGNLRFDFQIMISASKGLRPTLNEGTPKPLAELIQRCLNQNPEDRPTASECCDILALQKK